MVCNNAKRKGGRTCYLMRCERKIRGYRLMKNGRNVKRQRGAKRGTIGIVQMCAR